MDWSTPIDLYCERTDPSFWAEPVNAISNVAFLIAAGAGYLQWRRRGGSDTATLLFIVLTAVIGIGSFIFHTVATRGAVLFDTIPIAVFIYAYLFLALRRFLGLSLFGAAGLLIVFVAFSYAESAVVPGGTLNGSHEYLPAWGVTLVIGWFARNRPAGPYILGAAAMLAVSLVFRSIDNAVCNAMPLGTHFLWHILNAVVLYLLLQAAMSARASLKKATAA